MKKRILFVVNSMDCGGAEKSLLSLLSLFDYSKCDVDLQMFNCQGMFLPLLPDEITILPELPYSAFLKTQKGSLFFWSTRIKTSLGLRSKIKIQNQPLHDAQCFWHFSRTAFDALPTTYDAAIAWGQGNPTHFVAEKVTANKKIAIVNVNYEYAGHNKWFDYPYYEVFDHIISVSDALKEIMVQVYPEFSNKTTTIYDIRNQTLIQKMANEFDPYTRSENTAILVTVGRLVFQKGYDLAVEAGRILKNRGYQFEWYFVGDGPERQHLESLIKQNELETCIYVIGAKDNPYPYMKYADVYVQTSRFEGFCLTLCEARGLHTPPVSTNFDVVYDQIRDGENGLIVEMNATSIADGIELMLTDTSLRASIIENLKNERLGNEEEIEKLYNMLEGA